MLNISDEISIRQCARAVRATERGTLEYEFQVYLLSEWLNGLPPALQEEGETLAVDMIRGRVPCKL